MSLLAQCKIATTQILNFAKRGIGTENTTALQAFRLPSQRAADNISDQGWVIPTIVKPSNIPGAGNGRFAYADVEKGSQIVFKPIIPMADVSSVLPVPNNKCISFQDSDEVDNFIDLYQREGNQHRKDVIECLAHFMFLGRPLGSADGAGVLTLSFSTFTVNHGDPGPAENFRLFLDDGVIVGETVKDIKKGDELLTDYRYFEVLPEFWVNYCKKEGVKDVITTLKEHVDL